MVERLLQIFEYRGKFVCKGALLSKQCSGLIQVTGRVLKQADSFGLGLGQRISFRHARVERLAVDRLAASSDLGVELHAVEHALEELILGHQQPARQGDRGAVVIDGLAQPFILLNAKGSRADGRQGGAPLRLNLAHQVVGLIVLECSAGQIKAFNQSVA